MKLAERFLILMTMFMLIHVTIEVV